MHDRLKDVFKPVEQFYNLLNFQEFPVNLGGINKRC